MTYGFYAVLAVLLISLVLPISMVGATARSGATVSASPNTLAPGTVTLVSSSSNAFSGAAVNIYLSSNGYATISSSDVLLASNVLITSGTLTNENVTIPSTTAPGTYYVKVTDDNGATVVVSPALTVEASSVAPKISLNTSSGPVGAFIQVKGTNFVGTGSATLELVGPTGTITGLTITSGSLTPSSGTFTAVFKVPTLASGIYTVLATQTGTTSGEVLGASAQFTITPTLAPELKQWDSSLTTIIYSIRSGQAGLTLNFWGTGLPPGTVSSVTFYNSAGVAVTTGIFPAASVQANGQFNTTKLAANGDHELNVTLLGALSSGVGYYAMFDIGGVMIKSLPFIASTPTNGLFSACMSSGTNAYVCTTSASSSGSINTLVQGYGFGASDSVSVSVVNGGVTLLGPLATTADANGAVYFSVSSGSTHFPEQTADVVAVDHLASGQIQHTVGTYSLVPQLTINDITSGLGAEGSAGDQVELSGLSFPTPFQASTVTFTSTSNGYTTTVTTDYAGNNIQSKGYFSATNGDFAAASGSGSANQPLYVALPDLPGGNVSVTLTGATTGGASVTFTGYFWVDTVISNVYWINLAATSTLAGNSWQPFPTPPAAASLFSGDIIEVLANGYPTSATATVNFSANILTEMGSNIMGATASNNGALELILSIPNLPPSSVSGFGPYSLSLNGASASASLGQTLSTSWKVNVLLPGVYTGGQHPHVYVNPSMITPESMIGTNTPGVFPTAYTVNSTLDILGVGFTGSAKEYVYINATVSGGVPPASSGVAQYSSPYAVNTSVYGVFNLNVQLPNESSFVNTGTSSSPKWTPIIYKVSVDQYNPSAVIQTPSTSTPTRDQAVPFNVTPAITLEPTQGAPGTNVSIIGTGFAAGETAKIEVQTTTIVAPGTISVGPDGFFQINISMPAYAAGPVEVGAFGSSGVTSATAPFTITSVKPPTLWTIQVTAPSPTYVNGTEVINVITSLNSVPTNAASVSGTILQPNGVTYTLSFLSVGTGEYQAIYRVPNIAGSYIVTVSANSTTGQMSSSSTSFAVLPTTPPPTIPPSNTTIISQILSEIATLQASITNLQNALAGLSTQTQAALAALGTSLSNFASSLSNLSSRENAIETYSLGALVIAFIALIVIIYGVFVRRRP
jgi:hypothetical protein